VTRRPGAPRRNNAPIRPQRTPATTVPDLLFALAAAAWMMALIFLIASFLSADVTAGEAGRLLARLFAGALFMAGLFVALLGVGLLREERGDFDHYLVPIVVGIVIGALEATLFLIPAGILLWVPFLLLTFVLRPIRRWLGGRFSVARSFRA
jgi:hypothetical protein